MNEATVLKIPKIKKCQIVSKLLIDPADLSKGLPQSSLPELTARGMILSLSPQQVPLAKLSAEGTLKLSMKYNAETIELVDRYIEVTVIDDYDDFWVGTLFGITVQGTGGHGTVRGCKVTRIDGQTIVAEYIIEGENENWKKFEAKVEEILNNKK